MGKVMAKVGALLLCGSLAAILAPGCTITIGPGTGEDEPLRPVGDTAEPDNTSSTDGEMLSPEEQAAREAIQNVDPEDFRMKTAATSYAAVACASLVESQVADPEAVDPSTVTQLFEQYAPIAFDEAVAWVESVDPSLIPLEIKPDFACVKPPHPCPATVPCSFGSEPVFCHVTQCGKGKCPWCPFLDGLLYEEWCAYGCVRFGGNKLAGGAVMLRHRFGGGGWNGPHCKYFGD
ncbi:MAG TPA: hypothetical protein VE093_24150 [Polyangiaceae bacterium]|jgi:hypothetical protein|nr:hypothetical protein [Polyangiaceae bacterium]